MPTKSHMPPPVPRTARPGDATLSVTKAARVLGVHPNTVRAWSEAGRLRYYRINDRGDRRYRLGDLQRFLAAAESGAPAGALDVGPAPRAAGRRDAATPDCPDAHRDRRPGWTSSPISPRSPRCPPGSTRPGRGVPPDPHRDGRRARRHLGAPAGRPRPAGERRRRAAGSPRRGGAGRVARLFTLALESPEPIHARPGTDRATPPCSAWAPTSSSCASPAARRRGACSSSPGRWSSGRTTAPASPARSPARWACSSAAPARPSRPRAGCAGARPCGGSRPTSRRGSTSATSSATCPTTPGCCSAPTGWR